MVAAGTGSRMVGARPKQYLPLQDRRVLDWAVDTVDQVGPIALVVSPERFADPEPRAACVVAGGATRSASVRAGLAAVPDDAEFVLVHDAARPFASRELAARVLGAVEQGADGAIPAMPVIDTIKQIDGRRVLATLDRARLVAVQTPQAFRAAVLRSAHAAGGEATDDAALVESLGGSVVWVSGEAANRKLTTEEDLAWFESEAARRMAGARHPDPS